MRECPFYENPDPEIDIFIEDYWDRWKMINNNMVWEESCKKCMYYKKQCTWW